MSTNTRLPVWRPTGWLRVILVVAVAIAMTYFAWRNQQQEEQPQPKGPGGPAVEQPATNSPDSAAEPAPERTADAAQGAAAAASRSVNFSKTTFRDQRILDQHGNKVFRGDIDVRPTLERIKSGKRLSFPNDGSTFQNREQLLPKQPAGYYKEYVHPTPGLAGPGPQRIVMGREGETYYTPDHYKSFRRVDEP